MTASTALFGGAARPRPFAYARKHHDVRLLGRVMETLPAAEAAAGEVGNIEADVMEIGAHIDDVTDSGRGETAEMLWPLYLDCVRRHGTIAP
jgi:hypothetical protein